MQLKLEELQKVVKRVVNAEKSNELLMSEISKAIGPKVLTTHGVKLMAESANDQLDIIEKLGKKPNQVKTSVLLKHMTSNESEVRKLVARLLPENHVKNMMIDSDPSVRAAVAERLPRVFVREMMKKNPQDDHLRSIYNAKSLNEAGLPSPKEVEPHLDLYGEFPVGDAYDDTEHPGFTDTWYNSLAHKIINGPTAYGNNIEGNWEEKTVQNICNSYLSQGIEIDHDKLLKCVYDHMDMRDEASLKNESASLKSIVQRLRLEEAYNPVMLQVEVEETDPVADLLEGRHSMQSFMNEFEKLFQVEKGSVKNPGKKQGINESFSRIVSPSHAFLPAGNLRAVDEQALDMYVKHWNNKRNLLNQPYRLSWLPGANNKVNFQLGLK